MQMPDVLRDLWNRRAARESAWFVTHYEEAFGRIEDHTDGENPFWLGTGEDQAVPGEAEIWDHLGEPDSLHDARNRAFELLALCDLAEANRDA